MNLKMNMKREKPVWPRFLGAKVNVNLGKAARSQVLQGYFNWEQKTVRMSLAGFKSINKKRKQL